MTNEPPSDDEMDALTVERDSLRARGLGPGDAEYDDWFTRIILGIKDSPSE